MLVANNLFVDDKPWLEYCQEKINQMEVGTIFTVADLFDSQINGSELPDIGRAFADAVERSEVKFVELHEKKENNRYIRTEIANLFSIINSIKIKED